jgi:RNA polymerase sigma factor (sigma-70 family)
MADRQLSTVLRHLRTVAGTHYHHRSDRELLAAFTARNDQAAFTALVQRHGPMVLGVCRRVLHHLQDAEDVFQATFILLARRVADIRKPESLASWLHGVASRMAHNAKRSASRRRKHEGRAQPLPPVNPTAELAWREVQALLDDEVQRLPEIYRVPFILCCLENRSQAEVARQLGIKAGTVWSRLTHARRLLQQRLSRRGVALPAVVGLLAVSAEAAMAAVSGSLVSSTAQAAALSAAGSTTDGASARVIALVQGAQQAMPSKCKMATLVLLAVGVLGAGFGLAWHRPLGVQATEAVREGTPQAPSTAQPAESRPRVRETEERDDSRELGGHVTGPNGKPVAGAELLLVGRKQPAEKLGRTDEQGRFTVAVPRGEHSFVLAARAPGAGIDFIDLGSLKGKEQAELRLVKDHPIRGRVVNTEGKPVSGVTIALTHVAGYPDNSLDSFLVQWKNRNAMAGFPASIKAMGGETVFPRAMTDLAGRFTFQGVGIERLVTLHLRGAGLAEAEFYVVNRPGFDPRPLNKITLDKLEALKQNLIGLPPTWLLWGPNLEIVAEAAKPIRGVVKDFQTGKPRAGVRATLSRNGHDMVPIFLSATTDKEGRYEIHGAHKSAKGYMVEVPSDPATGYMACQGRAADTPGLEPVIIEVRSRKGVVITGRVIDQGTGKGLPGVVYVGVLADNAFAKDYPEFGSGATFNGVETAGDGTFRIMTIPGPVLLMGGPDYGKMPEGIRALLRYKPPIADPKYPQYFPQRRGPAEVFFTLGGARSVVQGSFAKVLEIQPDARTVNQDIILERASVLPVKIVDAAHRPVQGTWVAGMSPHEWHSPIQLAEALCDVYHLEPGTPRLLVVYDPAAKQFGTLRLKGDEKEPAVVKLGPGGTATGRLLDEKGRPLSGFRVGVSHEERTAEAIRAQVCPAKVTDADGKFAIELVPGAKWTMYFTHGNRTFRSVKQRDDSVAPGKTLDLGDLKINLEAPSSEK